MPTCGNRQRSPEEEIDRHAIQPAAMRTCLKTHYIGTLSKIVIYMEITRAWGVPLSRKKRKRKMKRKGKRERERERERGRGRRRRRERRKREEERKRNRKKKRNRKRKRKRNRERGRERKKKRKGKRQRKMNSGSALEKNAAIVNLENKPTKVKWTLSWPSALEICGTTVFK